MELYSPYCIFYGYDNLIIYPVLCILQVELLDSRYMAKPKFFDHVLRFFPDGAPCHSSLFFNFVDIIDRRDETELDYCEKVSQS